MLQQHHHFRVANFQDEDDCSPSNTNLIPTLSRNQLPISIVFAIIPTLQNDSTRLDIHNVPMRYALGFVVFPVDVFYPSRVSSRCDGLRDELDEARQVVGDLSVRIDVHEAWSSALLEMLESLVVCESVVPGSVPDLPDFLVG